MDSELKKHGLADVIVLSEAKFKQDENRRGAVGVGGTRILEFTSLSAGEGDLHLVNGREWELDTIKDNLEELDSFASKIIKVIVSPTGRHNDYW